MLGKSKEKQQGKQYISCKKTVCMTLTRTGNGAWKMEKESQLRDFYYVLLHKLK